VRHITPQNLRRAKGTLIIIAGYLGALAAVQASASAQEKTTLRKVEIVGLQRLAPDQVIATSGLHVGDLIDGLAIDAAADKLMRSGWFQSVNYRVQTADFDSTVIFEVAEKTTPSRNPPAGDVLGNVTWSGNKALTELELANAFGLRPDDASSAAQIDRALATVRTAYGRRGFINAQVVPSSTRDSANHRVNYDFVVREGQQYRMGAVSLLGVGAADAAALKNKWTLAPNAVFDTSYLDQFKSSVIRPFAVSQTQRTGKPAKFDMEMKPSLQKLTVDVLITFR
jgi:outer membrane protein assembly factor BamA